MNRALRRKQQKLQEKQTRNVLLTGTTIERLHAGAALHRQRKYAEAITYYDTVLNTDPNHTDALYLKGGSLIELRQYDEAIELLKHCVSLKDDIAAAHHNLGLAYKEKNMLEEAIPHLERAAVLDPQNQITTFHLKTAKEGNTDKSSPAYVKNLYDRAAGLFEENLVGHLGYKGPEVLWALINAHSPHKHYENVIDLGCGTGLMAPLLRPVSGHLIGVDLSDSMVKEAKKKNLYDTLVAAPLEDYLTQDTMTYTLITSADVFIYLKDLGYVFKMMFQRLEKGGLAAYSVELLEEDAEADVIVDPATHRHKHKYAYLKKIAEQAGFVELGVKHESFRIEGGQPVKSLCVLLTRQ